MYTEKKLIKQLMLTKDWNVKTEGIITYLLNAKEYCSSATDPDGRARMLNLEEIHALLVYVKSLGDSTSKKRIDSDLCKIFLLTGIEVFYNELDRVNTSALSQEQSSYLYQQSERIDRITKKSYCNKSELFLTVLLRVMNYVKQSDDLINLDSMCDPVIEQLINYRCNERYYCSKYFSPFEVGMSKDEYFDGFYDCIANEGGNRKYKEFLCNIKGQKLIPICG